MVTNCPKCGLPRFAGVGGYAGPQCTCLVTNFAVVDPVVRQQQEIESLRQQLSASQKREVTLRKLIGEIYCSDDSSAEVTRKIEDVLSAMGNSYSKESTQGFEDWHSSHAKYMEPADIIHWCRDAYNAGVIAVQSELNAERNRRFEGNRISSQEYNDCQKRDVMLREALEDKATKALFRAWSLGQKYWQQADSDSYTQNAKATMTQKKFQELIDEFRSGEWTPETLAGERLEAIFYQDGNGTRWVYSEDACASISGPDSDDREIGRAVLCLGANP